MKERTWRRLVTLGKQALLGLAVLYAVAKFPFKQIIVIYQNY